MKNEWQILNISPTSDIKIIKNAYAKKLAQCHPEETPEQFKVIQEAYTSIMNSLAQPHPTQTAVENSESDAELYEECNLRAQFANVDHQAFVKIQEATTSSKEDATRNMDTKEYCDIINKQLQKKPDKSTFEELILHYHFIEKCENEDLYKQICRLIAAYVPRFDNITKSYLTEIFTMLDRKHPNHPLELRIPYIISMPELRKMKIHGQLYKFKKAIICIGWFLLLFFLLLLREFMMRAR